MIEELTQYIAEQIERATGMPCKPSLVSIEEDIQSDSLSLLLGGQFISSFELFDEETVEEMAVELLDGQWSEIQEVLNELHIQQN